MSDGFENDLKRALTTAGTAHSQLLAVLAELSSADLELSLRGGWTIRRVLEHLIQSYAGELSIVQRIRGLESQASGEEPLPGFQTPGEVARRLDDDFRSLSAAINGVDEEAFYRLVPPGRNEYSVLSLLENIADHDAEHAEQIKTISKSGKR
jgi:hypothetical protein